MSYGNIQAFILAGGFGTRLQSVLPDIPKPMAPIQDKPFLEYLIQYLNRSHIQNVTILTGYKSDLIKDHFQDGKKWNTNITYSHEDTPMGTGGAIALAMKKYPSSKYLILNGDTFFDIDIPDFINQSKQPINIALKKMDDISRYGSVTLDDDSFIIQFIEKKSHATPGYINGGIYIINSSIQEYFPKTDFFSLEKDVFEKITNQKKIKGVIYSGNFIDIGIPSSYKEAQNLIPKWVNR